MCVNYAPIQRQVLRDIFGVEPPAGDWKAEAWPDYPAPIVRVADSGAREAVMGSFSMVPKGRIPPGVRYYPTANARIETIGQALEGGAALPDPRDGVLRAKLGDGQSCEMEDRLAWRRTFRHRRTVARLARRRRQLYDAHAQR